MKPEISVHIIPREGRWAVTRSGAKRTVRIFDTKPEAAAYVARSYRSKRLRIYVHDFTGRIERKVLR